MALINHELNQPPKFQNNSSDMDELELDAESNLAKRNHKHNISLNVVSLWYSHKRLQNIGLELTE